MKILDILFVVFELYNFVGLFKLRKSAKKEIKVIKEQKATEHMNEELYQGHKDNNRKSQYRGH